MKGRDHAAALIAAVNSALPGPRRERDTFSPDTNGCSYKL